MFRIASVINKGYHGFNPVQFGTERCKPLHSFGPAVRDHWLLHYVVSGKGIFLRDGEINHVNTGEFFIIPPFCETFYQADEENPWEYIWVGFKTEEELPEAFNSPVIKSPRSGEIFRDMLKCFDFENGRSAFLTAKIWELISVTLESGKVSSDYIETAVHCMNSEYMNNLTVADLSARLGLDRCYFSTLFTKTMGVSPAKYLIDLRLKKAEELMITYRESPSVAAFSVGYTDICNFSKSFKQKYGSSPRSYIKQNKGG